MPNRLDELRKQRARLLEVLSWIEGEIIAEGSRGGSSGLPPATRPVPDPLAPTAGQPEAEADLILEQYRDASRNLTQNVRSGCFVYFALALVLLIACVVGWYWIRYRHH